MTRDEYEHVLKLGQGLFQKIVLDLNKVSTKHIRKDKLRSKTDYNEICIALVLWERYKYHQHELYNKELTRDGNKKKV